MDLMDAMKLTLVIKDQGGTTQHGTSNCTCLKSFTVPYLDGPGEITACAHCDSALGWPRFKKGMDAK